MYPFLSFEQQRDKNGTEITKHLFKVDLRFECVLRVRENIPEKNVALLFISSENKRQRTNLASRYRDGKVHSD